MYIEFLRIVIPMGIMILIGRLIRATKLSSPESESMLDQRGGGMNVTIVRIDISAVHPSNDIAFRAVMRKED